MESLGGVDGVLARHRIDHQQRVMRFEHLGHLGHLGHQLIVDG